LREQDCPRAQGDGRAGRERLHAVHVDAIAAFNQGDLSFADVILVIARFDIEA